MRHYRGLISFLATGHMPPTTGKSFSSSSQLAYHHPVASEKKKICERGIAKKEARFQENNGSFLGFLVWLCVLSLVSSRVLTFRDALSLGSGLSLSSCKKLCSRGSPLWVASKSGGSLIAALPLLSSIDPVVSDTKFVFDRSTAGEGSRSGARPGLPTPVRAALKSPREKAGALTFVVFAIPGDMGPLGERPK